MESKIEALVLRHLSQFPKLVKIDRGVESTVPQGKTTLTFGDSSDIFDARSPCSIAEIETIFTGQLANLDEVTLAGLNRRTIWGNFFERDGQLGLRLSCSIYQDEPAAEWIASLLMQGLGEQLAVGFGNIKAYLSPNNLPHSRANLEFPRSWANLFEPGCFSAAAKQFSDQGWVSTGQESSFTLEVPMGPGGASRMIEKSAETALLRVDVGVPHPLAGVGYFGSIALPINPKADDIPAISCRLNALEHELADFPPRFGAWATRCTGKELVYAVFLPNVRADSGIPKTMMAWLVRRALWLRDEIWEPRHGVNIEVSDHE